ncbi:MAG: PepSY domain-containing protein, partial [Paracoccaceae bacterium]
MKRIFALAAFFALPAGASFANIDTNGLISQFQGDGYTTIEVTRGITETKVEAIRNNEKVEVVYDNATGAVLETEFGTPDADDDIRPGVTVRDRNRDFVRDDDDRDDDLDDDRDDDRDDDLDDDRDDDSDDNRDDDRDDDR